MFGYLKPDRPYLYLKDDVLYKSLYCGVCKSIGKLCGQKARFTLSNDVTFLSAFCHNVMGEDVKIQKKRCIAHWIKRRQICDVDEISTKLGAINVLLAYYKVKDDILDEKKGGFKSSLLKKGYKKAKKFMPMADEIIKNGYLELLTYESKNSDSIDMVSDCFASIIAKLSELILLDKGTENTYNVLYAIGKWVYLIDALDDYDKDIKNGNFNVFYNLYKFSDYETLIKEKKPELLYIFNGIFSIIQENYKNIKTYFNTDLIVNVLTRGIPNETLKVLDKGNKKNDKWLLQNFRG